MIVHGCQMCQGCATTVPVPVWPACMVLCTLGQDGNGNSALRSLILRPVPSVSQLGRPLVNDSTRSAAPTTVTVCSGLAQLCMRWRPRAVDLASDSRLDADSLPLVTPLGWSSPAGLDADLSSASVSCHKWFDHRRDRVTVAVCSRLCTCGAAAISTVFAAWTSFD